MHLFLLIIQHLLITGLATTTNNDFLEVQTNQGIIRGKLDQSRKGREFRVFTGIPYAQPPVRGLRFKPPLPVKPWEGIFNATSSHPICPQRRALQILGNEDCLYLNVYSPQLPTANNQPLSVMFYIHGGGFLVGSAGPDWYEPNVLLDKNIVLVIPNYRLGIFGFLSTGDKVVPGNNGLKDLVQALRWTKDNIKAFGGNPNKITVSGHSAGGAAAHYLMLSPLSKDLINGAIVQSGTALDGWSLARNNEEIKSTKRLAQYLNCNVSSNDAMIECMRKIDANVIIEQDIKFLEWSSEPAIIFKPVIEPDVDGAFITQHPMEIIKSGNAASVPLLIGIATEDGALRSAKYYGNPNLINNIDSDFNRVIPISLRYMENKHISEQLRHFYFGNASIDNSTKKELTNLYTDALFLLGADTSIRLHTEWNTMPVYYYLFGYRGTESHSKLYGDPLHNYGVCHGDILLYLFELKTSFPHYQPNTTDNEMTNILTTLLENFVTTGNPTPNGTFRTAIKWKPVKFGADLNYLFIKNPNDLKMDEGLYTERARFLRELNIYT